MKYKLIHACLFFSALQILSESVFKYHEYFNSISYSTKIDNEFLRTQWCPSYLGGGGGGRWWWKWGLGIWPPYWGEKPSSSGNMLCYNIYPLETAKMRHKSRFWKLHLGSFLKKIRSFHFRPGKSRAGVHPYLGYIGMCPPKDMVFQLFPAEGKITDFRFLRVPGSKVLHG